MWEKIKEKIKNFFNIKTNKNLIFTLITAGVIVLSIIVDQITKHIVSSKMALYQSIPIIKNVLHITYIKNEGAAFGMLANHRWVFMVISTIAIIALIVYLFGFCKENRFVKIGLALVIGGGIGNMIDRTSLGYVVDMIDCQFINFYIFNVADSCVCVGAGVIFLGIILAITKEKKKQTKEEKEEK